MLNRLWLGKTGLRRRFQRVPVSGRVSCRCERDDGCAELVNASHFGLRLRLGRYLPPGSFLLLKVRVNSADGDLGELKAQIVWCAPVGDFTVFEAGLRVLFDVTDAAALGAALVQQANRQATKPAPFLGLRERNTLLCKV